MPKTKRYLFDEELLNTFETSKKEESKEEKEKSDKEQEANNLVKDAIEYKGYLIVPSSYSWVIRKDNKFVTEVATEKEAYEYIDNLEESQKDDGEEVDKEIEETKVGDIKQSELDRYYGKLREIIYTLKKKLSKQEQQKLIEEGLNRLTSSIAQAARLDDSLEEVFSADEIEKLKLLVKEDTIEKLINLIKEDSEEVEADIEEKVEDEDEKAPIKKDQIKNKDAKKQKDSFRAFNGLYDSGYEEDEFEEDIISKTWAARKIKEEK